MEVNDAFRLLQYSLPAMESKSNVDREFGLEGYPPRDPVASGSDAGRSGASSRGKSSDLASGSAKGIRPPSPVKAHTSANLQVGGSESSTSGPRADGEAALRRAATTPAPDRQASASSLDSGGGTGRTGSRPGSSAAGSAGGRSPKAKSGAKGFGSSPSGKSVGSATQLFGRHDDPDVDPPASGTIQRGTSSNSSSSNLRPAEQGTVGGIPVPGAVYPVFDQSTAIAVDPESPGDIHFKKLENWDYMRKAVAASHLEYVNSQSWAQTDVFGWTILHFAADGNSAAVFHLLKETATKIRLPAGSGERRSSSHASNASSVNSADMELNAIAGTLWAALLERPERDLQKPLHVAARANSKEVTQLLLSSRASPGSRDFNLFTPLIAGSIHGNTSTIDVLAAACSKQLVDAADKDGRSAIHWATIHGHVETCKLLICNAASLNQKDNFGRTAVEAAKDHQNQLIVVREVHALNLEMLEAAKNRETETVRECLEKGAQLDAMDDDGWTALVWAALNRKIDLMQMLIMKGASVYLRDQVGKTAADYAAQMGDNQKVLEQLFACNKGLYHAAETRHPVRPFLELKAYPEYVAEHNFSKWTPLMWAAFNADKESVQVLMDAKADPLRKDLHGEDAKFHCCRGPMRGALRPRLTVTGGTESESETKVASVCAVAEPDVVDTFRLLVASFGVAAHPPVAVKSTLRDRNLDGYTVLHVAVENNKAALVACLLASDIRLMEDALPRAVSRLPFTRACELGYGEVVKVFLRSFCETTEIPNRDFSGDSEDYYSSVPPSEAAEASAAFLQQQRGVSFADPARRVRDATWMTADVFGPGDFVLKNQEGSAGFFKVCEGGLVAPKVPGYFVEISVGRNVHREVSRRLGEKGDAATNATRFLQLYRGDDNPSEILPSGSMVVARNQWTALKVGYTSAVLEYRNGRFSFSTGAELLQMIDEGKQEQRGTANGDDSENPNQANKREVEPGCILYFENAPPGDAAEDGSPVKRKLKNGENYGQGSEDDDLDGVAVAAGETYLFVEDFTRLSEYDRILAIDAGRPLSDTVLASLEQQLENGSVQGGYASVQGRLSDGHALRDAFLREQPLDAYMHPFVGEVRCLAMSDEGLPVDEAQSVDDEADDGGEAIDGADGEGGADPSSPTDLDAPSGSNLSDASSSRRRRNRTVDLRLEERQKVRSRWVENYPTPSNKRQAMKRLPAFNSIEAHHEEGRLSPLHLCVKAGCVAGAVAILNHEYEFSYRRLLVYLAPNLLVLAAQSGSYDCANWLLQSDVKPAWQFEKIWQAVLRRAVREATTRKYPKLCTLLQPFAYLPERNLEYRCYLYGFPHGLDEMQFRDWLDDQLTDLRSSLLPSFDYECGPLQEHVVDVQVKGSFWVATKDWEVFCNVLDVSGETYQYSSPPTRYMLEKMPHMLAFAEDATKSHRQHTISVMACYHTEFITQYLAAVYRVRKQGDSPKRSRGVSPTGKQRRLRALGPFLGGEVVRSEDY
eukprot:g6788.t1